MFGGAFEEARQGGVKLRLVEQEGVVALVGLDLDEADIGGYGVQRMDDRPAFGGGEQPVAGERDDAEAHLGAAKGIGQHPAVITGQVLDRFGDPVERAFVHAIPIAGNSTMSIVVDRMHGVTDDRGQFRIVGAPGKYYVSATGRTAAVTHREIRSDGTEAQVYAQTWYPDAEGQTHSQIVEVAAGREVSEIDIRLASKRSFRISGIVTGIPPGVGPVEVFANTRSNGFPAAKVDAEGRFAFSGLSPGQYEITARVVSGTTRLISRAVEVPLEAGNDDNVALELAAGQDITGRIEFAGGQPEGHKVRLEAVTGMHYVEAQGGQETGEVDRAGNFTIASVFPGKFRVHVEPMAENAYVGTVQVNGAPVPRDLIDLSGGVKGSSLRITVGANGGQVSGSVASDDGKPVCCAMVVLAASVDEVNDRMSSIKGGGKYSFGGLRPGKYRLIVSGPADAYGTQTAEAKFAAAPEIEVHEGERIIRDVTFPPGRSPDAKP